MSDEACLFLLFVSSIIWWLLYVALSRPAPTADEADESRCAYCPFCDLPLLVCDGDCWQSERGERTDA